MRPSMRTHHLDPQRCMHVRWVLRSVVQRAGEGGLGTGSGESRCAWATMRHAPEMPMGCLSTSWTTWSIQRYPLGSQRASLGFMAWGREPAAGRSGVAREVWEKCTLQINAPQHTLSI
jgi:hypothetical protein